MNAPLCKIGGRVFVVCAAEHDFSRAYDALVRACILFWGLKRLRESGIMESGKFALKGDLWNSK